MKEVDVITAWDGVMWLDSVFELRMSLILKRE